jgi:hypothetical protein
MLITLFFSFKKSSRWIGNRPFWESWYKANSQRDESWLEHWRGLSIAVVCRGVYLMLYCTGSHHPFFMSYPQIKCFIQCGVADPDPNMQVSSLIWVGWIRILVGKITHIKDKTVLLWSYEVLITLHIAPVRMQHTVPQRIPLHSVYLKILPHTVSVRILMHTVPLRIPLHTVQFLKEFSTSTTFL